MNDIPRSHDMQRWTPAERAIYDAMQVVEAMGADVRLTDAVVLLGAAREKVADYVDGKPAGDDRCPACLRPTREAAGQTAPEPAAAGGAGADEDERALCRQLVSDSIRINNALVEAMPVGAPDSAPVIDRIRWLGQERARLTAERDEAQQEVTRLRTALNAEQETCHQSIEVGNGLLQELSGLRTAHQRLREVAEMVLDVAHVEMPPALIRAAEAALKEQP